MWNSVAEKYVNMLKIEKTVTDKCFPTESAFFKGVWTDFHEDGRFLMVFQQKASFLKDDGMNFAKKN